MFKSHFFFHSNDVTGHSLEQEWILSVIKDGLKDELDYAIMQQNFILKMILSFKGSSLCQSKAGSLILDIVKVQSVNQKKFTIISSMITHNGSRGRPLPVKTASKPISYQIGCWTKPATDLFFLIQYKNFPFF